MAIINAKHVYEKCPVPMCSNHVCYEVGVGGQKLKICGDCFSELVRAMRLAGHTRDHKAAGSNTIGGRYSNGGAH